MKPITKYKKGDKVILNGDRDKYKYYVNNNTHETIWSESKTPRWIGKKVTIKYLFHSLTFGGYLFRIEENENVIFPLTDVIKSENYFGEDILKDLKI
jgi:hypothetical protein